MASRKGIPNRPKRRLLQILEEKYPGWHPVAQLADIANNVENDLKTRMDAAKEVAQYVTPKLKAVEIHDNTATGLSELLQQLNDATALVNGADTSPPVPAPAPKRLN